MGGWVDLWRSVKKADFLYIESRDFIRRQDISAQAKTLCGILRSYCNGEAMCYPTIPQLSRDSGLSESTTEKYLDELREKEIIAWNIFRDEHQHLRRLYKLRQYQRKAGGKIYPVGQGVKSTPLSVTILNQRLFVWPAWCQESKMGSSCDMRAP